MKGGRILVIDDEPMVREAVGRMLVAEGYAVDHANDGASALALLDVDPPDVILLDLMMPGMNGRQFLTVLRDDRGSDVPVVVMTAVHGLGQRAVDLGATDVVEKPFDLDELLNKVALAVFRGRRRAVPSRSVRHLALPQQPGPEERVIVVIDRDLVALAHIDELLSRHGFTVVPVPELNDDVRRTLRALGPRAIVLGQGATAGDEPTADELRLVTGLRDVPILAWRRSAEPASEPSPLDGPADVTLTRPADDDLVRTVALMSGLTAAEPSRPRS